MLFLNKIIFMLYLPRVDNDNENDIIIILFGALIKNCYIDILK